MKKLLQFFLFNNWTDVFSSNVKREIKLTTEDYVAALEILSGAERIPHGFDALLFQICIDYDEKGYKKMWDEPFIKKTAKTIEIIFTKALKNRYIINSEPYIETEKGLKILRAISVDYSNYEEVKSFYEKFSDFTKKAENQKWKEVGELVDSCS